MLLGSKRFSRQDGGPCVFKYHGKVCARQYLNPIACSFNDGQESCWEYDKVRALQHCQTLQGLDDLRCVKQGGSFSLEDSRAWQSLGGQ